MANASTSLGSIRSGTQAVERALGILKEVMAGNASGISRSVLLKRMPFHRTTSYRLLKCLVQQGAIRYSESTKRYFLGPLALELGISAREQFDVKDILSPIASKIAALTGDTSFVMLRSGNDSVCIDRHLGSYPIKAIVVEVGTRRPLGIGAGGLAILSSLPKDEMQEVIKANAPKLSQFGASKENLLKYALSTRKKGFAITPVHGVPGVLAIGLPIVDSKNNVIAALSIAAIANRFPKSRQIELAKLLKKETRPLSKLLSNVSLD